MPVGPNEFLAYTLQVDFITLCLYIWKMQNEYLFNKHQSFLVSRKFKTLYVIWEQNIIGILYPSGIQQDIWLPPQRCM